MQLDSCVPGIRPSISEVIGVTVVLISPCIVAQTALSRKIGPAEWVHLYFGALCVKTARYTLAPHAHLPRILLAYNGQKGAGEHTLRWSAPNSNYTPQRV